MTYRVTGLTEAGWELLTLEAEKTVALNKTLVSCEVTPPTDSDTDGGYVVLVAAGHDRSMIVRRIARPIIGFFNRAAVASRSVQLIGSRILPTARNLTLAEGRTPPGTYTDGALRQMLADHGDTLRE